MTTKAPPLVASSDPVVLVGGGPVTTEALDWARGAGGPLVAADSGAETLLSCGHLPAAVIGDMDSLAPATRHRLPEGLLHRVAEQESTDFEKCLQRIRAPLVLGLGFLGGRMDHSLAALSCLARHPAPCLLLGPETVAFAAPPDLRLDLDPGMRLSLFPLAPVTGRSQGLRWPIDGIPFAPAGRIGTSNEVTGPVRLFFEAPGMIVLLPPEARDAARRALIPDAAKAFAKPDPFG